MVPLNAAENCVRKLGVGPVPALGPAGRGVRVACRRDSEASASIRRIEAAIARVDRLTAEAARAPHLLDRLDERLAKAFRGELVPQDPADERAEALLARIRAARDGTARQRRRRRSSAAA